jgi:nitrite reductase/ring-hydroxylating ferredoxin subunit
VARRSASSDGRLGANRRMTGRSERHVVARAEQLPPGNRLRVSVRGRAVVVFNEGGRLYAVRDICPHRGAELSAGTVVGSFQASMPGRYRFDGERPLIKCPWHGWEFDLATGRSLCDPDHERVRAYDVSVEAGSCLGEPAASLEQSEHAPGERAPGPYVAETLPVSVESDYIVIRA